MRFEGENLLDFHKEIIIKKDSGCDVLMINDVLNTKMHITQILDK